MTTKIIAEVLGVDKSDGHLKTDILQVPYEDATDVPSDTKLIKLVNSMVRDRFKEVDAWRVTRVETNERRTIRQGETVLIKETRNKIIRDFTSDEERKWQEFRQTGIELVS